MSDELGVPDGVERQYKVGQDDKSLPPSIWLYDSVDRQRLEARHVYWCDNYISEFWDGRMDA